MLFIFLLGHSVNAATESEKERQQKLLEAELERIDKEISKNQSLLKGKGISQYCS